MIKSLDFIVYCEVLNTLFVAYTEGLKSDSLSASYQFRLLDLIIIRVSVESRNTTIPSQLGMYLAQNILLR